MRMMLKIMLPTEAGNRTIKDGLPKILEDAVARLKAELRISWRKMACGRR
jgi:hypothetical protein